MGPVYRFATSWRLAAPADTVYDALKDVDAYVRWWPQVRRVSRIDDDCGSVSIRSLLPYTLELVLRREVEDPGTGELRVAVRGDLHGWSAWHLGQGDDGTTVASYRQEVELRAPVLRQVSFAARPLLRANHTVMMRDGERGLRAHLA